MQPLPLYFPPDSGQLEIGIDEVGRGCLAGPVVAAAVILPPHFDCTGLNDSKQVKLAERQSLAYDIMDSGALVSIGIVDVTTIDTVNIANASYLAMEQAASPIAHLADLALIDGHRFTAKLPIPHLCVIKGDGTYASIAAASIIAKVCRDEWMADAALQYPGYGWETNVGYGTAKHLEGIKLQGVTPLHRRTFSPVREWLAHNLFGEALLSS